MACTHRELAPGSEQDVPVLEGHPREAVAVIDRVPKDLKVGRDQQHRIPREEQGT
jgi:hypothetical protein